jgi:hypothetical protein
MKQKISLLFLSIFIASSILCGGSDDEVEESIPESTNITQAVQPTYEPAVPQAQPQVAEEKPDKKASAPEASADETEQAREKYSLGKLIGVINTNNQTRKFHKYWCNLEQRPQNEWEWAKLLSATDTNLFMRQKVAEDKIVSIKLSSKTKEEELSTAQKNLASALAMKKFMDHEFLTTFEATPTDVFKSLISFKE